MLALRLPTCIFEPIYTLVSMGEAFVHFFKVRPPNKFGHQVVPKTDWLFPELNP